MLTHACKTIELRESAGSTLNSSSQSLRHGVLYSSAIIFNQLHINDINGFKWRMSRPLASYVPFSLRGDL